MLYQLSYTGVMAGEYIESVELVKPSCLIRLKKIGRVTNVGLAGVWEGERVYGGAGIFCGWLGIRLLGCCKNGACGIGMLGVAAGFGRLGGSEILPGLLNQWVAGAGWRRLVGRGFVGWRFAGICGLGALCIGLVSTAGADE
ncbi:hypothetical protein EGJ27_23840 [Pseudomonas sp. v388]|nr:hypothetical protein EGJ27_23840 [Pseudomonas sp. v388]